MKPKLCMRIGYKYKDIDVIDLVAREFKVSRSEAKRLYKQGAIEICYLEKDVVIVK